MPVKLGSKLPQESAEARIEIVPLIDIMFFLLASFMLVSLSMVNLKSVKVKLPTAVAASSESAGKNISSLSVDKAGGLWLDQKPVGENELVTRLKELKEGNPKFQLLLSGDAEAGYGAVVHALDLARRAGVEQIAFETKAAPAAKEGAR